MDKGRISFIIRDIAITAVVFIVAMFVGAYLQWDSGVFFESLDKPDVGYTEGGA